MLLFCCNAIHGCSRTGNCMTNELFFIHMCYTFPLDAGTFSKCSKQQEHAVVKTTRVNNRSKGWKNIEICFQLRQNKNTTKIRIIYELQICLGRWDLINIETMFIIHSVVEEIVKVERICFVNYYRRFTELWINLLQRIIKVLKWICWYHSGKFVEFQSHIMLVNAYQKAHIIQINR